MIQYSQLVQFGAEITCLDINSRGSGFILRKDGLIGTNWHVVHNRNDGTASKNISVKFKDGKIVSAIVKKTDQLKDFAILKIQGSFDVEPVIYDYQSVEPYQEIYFVGRGLDVPVISLHRGWISAKAQKDGIDILQIDGPVNQGNSGGGVFDRDGRLLGMVTQTEAQFDPDLTALWQLMPQLTMGGDIEMFGIRIPETLQRIIYYLDRNRHVGIGYAFSIEYIKEALGKL